MAPLNIAFMMGGALGLSILASIATSKTDLLSGMGLDHASALVSGYHAAFLAGSIFAAVAAALAGLLLGKETATAPSN